MATSFELGDEQPPVYKERAQILKASSYQNLFGAPVGRSRPRVRREVRAERDQPVRGYKPQSVNTWTGEVIGVQDQKIHQALSVPQPKYSGKCACTAFYLRDFKQKQRVYNHHSHSSPKIVCIPRWYYLSRAGMYCAARYRQEVSALFSYGEFLLKAHFSVVSLCQGGQHL